MNLNRRRLFGFMLAAPAIVAAPSLMRVSTAAVTVAVEVAPANGLLTSDIILREALMHLENELVLSKLVNRDYEREFSAGPITIRRPMRLWS
jgi:hypothetical protein